MIQPLGAALAIASFLLPTGEIAGLAAAGWLVVTVLLSSSGLRVVRHIFTRPEVACMEAGLLYLPVGGIWLVLSRLGETPLALGEPIILLTAGPLPTTPDSRLPCWPARPDGRFLRREDYSALWRSA